MHARWEGSGEGANRRASRRYRTYVRYCTYDTVLFRLARSLGWWRGLGVEVECSEGVG